MYIVLGKNGYIAEAIIKELTSRNLHHISFSRSDLDYTDFEKFSNYAHIHYNDFINPFKNATIINCAGYIGKPNVDACESSKADTIVGNVVFPANLAAFCSQNCVTLAHISSGCIYNGYSKHFTEEDSPNFDFQNGSFYSGTKALAEQLILKQDPNSYIFRLRIPFDEYVSPRNYITKILNYDKLLNAENSFSHRADFAKYTIDLLESNAPKGIYNVTNKGSMTTEEAIEMIKDHKISNKNFEFFDNLDSFTSEVVAPRSNCVLDTSKIENQIPVRTVREAFLDALSKYPKKMSVN